ncbi:hypothetical protein ACLH0M_14700 [Aeromonas media]
MWEAKLMLQSMVTNEWDAMTPFGIKKVEEMLYSISEKCSEFLEKGGEIGNGEMLDNTFANGTKNNWLVELVVDRYRAVRGNAHNEPNIAHLSVALEKTISGHYMTNPTDAEGKRHAANALRSMLTPSGDDISQLGLVIVALVLCGIENGLSEQAMADTFEQFDCLDSQRRQQRMMWWAQRVASAYRAYNGDFYQVGEMVIPLNNERFTAYIASSFNYCLQEVTDTFLEKIPELQAMDERCVIGMLKVMLMKDGGLSADGHQIINAGLQLSFDRGREGWNKNDESTFELQVRGPRVGEVG